MKNSLTGSVRVVEYTKPWGGAAARRVAFYETARTCILIRSRGEDTGVTREEGRLIMSLTVGTALPLPRKMAGAKLSRLRGVKKWKKKKHT